MRFHPELGPTPIVGVEWEVARWKRGSNMKTVAAQLEGQGAMPADVFSQGRHDYHCRCNVCSNIGSTVTFPVMFKLQRDASLPELGGEFISSPFPLDEVFLAQAMAAYNTIGAKAVPPDAATYDQRGNRLSEVGMHVHAYSGGPQLKGMISDSGMDLTMRAARTFVGFAPELFRLAAANNENRNRSLHFRIPSSMQGATVAEFGDVQPEHLFVISTNQKVTRQPRNVDPHVEWRFWELPYCDEDYVRGACIISAALTQILHRGRLLEKLEHVVGLMPWDDGGVVDQADLLERFSRRRFDMLATLILTGTGLAEEPGLRGQAERLLNRVG